MRTPLKYALVILASAAAGAGALYGVTAQQSPSDPPALEWPARAASAPEPLAPRPGGVFDFADLVEQSEPSVVQVRVEKANEPRAARGAPPSPLDPFEDSPLREYFRKFMPPEDAPGAPGAPGSPFGPQEEDDEEDGRSSGLGSGFFIDEQGHLLTNAHVVEGADRVTLRLKDRREIKARVIGADKRTDIALLKADGPGPFKPLKVGNPDASRVGEWVLAIGSPFGFESTATVGILSAKERSLPQDDNYLPFLQTDAAVNPGNSGGPLLSHRGEVIGINTQIYSRSGGYMGISFSLPIDYAMRIAGKLKKSGSVDHGRIGATIQEMSPELARALGVSDGRGAVVISVASGSPAAKAGLQSGDALVGVNGKRVESSSAFVRFIAESDPGSKVALDLVRKGKRQQALVIVGSASAVEKTSLPAKPAPAPEKTASDHQALGLLLAPPKPGVPGLRVLSASREAAEAGVLKNDLLLIADGEPLTSAAQLRRIGAARPADVPIAALVQRGAESLFIALPRG